MRIAHPDRSQNLPTRPHLNNYLQSLYMPLDPVENFIRARNHPVRLDKLDDLTRQAWEFCSKIGVRILLIGIGEGAKPCPMPINVA